MRNVNVVKAKRDELREDLAIFIKVRENKFPLMAKYTELPEYDRKLYSYIQSCIGNLKRKINALEFVLNEDTEMTDGTTPFPSHKEIGITKELIFKLANETSDREVFID